MMCKRINGIPSSCMGRLFFVVDALFLFCFFEPIVYKKPLDAQSTSGTLSHTCSTGSFWDHKYLTLLLAGSLPQVAFILVALSIGATHRHVVTVTLRNKEKHTNKKLWLLLDSIFPQHPQDKLPFSKPTTFGVQWSQVVAL